LNELNDKLGREMSDLNDKDLDSLVLEIRKAEQELKDTNLKAKINSINKREAIKRDVLASLCTVGMFDSELVTNDGKLNKTKRKQAPNLYDFIDTLEYYHISFGYDGVPKLNTNGNTYYMYSKDYSTKEFKPFESFEDACNFNRVLTEVVKFGEVKAKLKKLAKIEAKFKEQCNKYEESKNELNIYFLSGEGIAQQQNANIHTHYSNF